MRERIALRPRSIAAFVLAASGVGRFFAQTPGTGGDPLCPEQARRLTTTAGNYSTGTQECPSISFTITIMGTSFTFTTPSSCDTGRREQDADCFECGVPSEGNRCKSRGFQVTVKIYSIGGGSPCPEIPDPLPTTLEAAQAAVMCKPLPLIHTEKTWCAKDEPCDPAVTASEGNGEVLVLAEGLGERRTWEGDPAPLLAPPQPRPDREALAALPREPLSRLPEALANAYLRHASVEGGVELSTTVELVFRRGPGEEIVNRYDVRGVVLGDGRCALELPQLVPDEDGRHVAFVEELVYDGASLFTGTKDAPVHQAYASTYFDLPAVLRQLLGPFQPLFGWVDSPFGILRLPGTEYASLYLQDAGGPRFEIAETYPGIEIPGGGGSTQYVLALADGDPRPERIDVLDSTGRLVVRRTFGDYRELTQGLARPFELREERFSRGEAAPWLTTYVRIHAARATPDAEQRLVPPESRSWYVYR